MKLLITASFCFGISNAFAFHPTATKVFFQTSTSLKSSPITYDEITTRRQWATKSASAASALALLSNPQASVASTAIAPQNKSVPSSSSLCDASVSTFRNPNNNRIVHILGTAHISSSSADVAGSLVREVKPQAVFVELDAKRVGRAIPKPASSADVSQQTDTDSFTESSAGLTPASSPANASASASTSAPALGDVVQTTMQQDTQPSAQPKSKNPFNIKERLLNTASQAVGNGIKGLYQKLESEGFSAGEEFVVSVREGLKIGSTIILGDQDVELTLRRLTEALSKTDLRKLLAADSEMEQNMKGLMPDNGKSINESGEMSKEELTYFVETVKAKENVKALMASLNAVAPEVYQAMVGERDLYMANGLDRLNQFESIVAVMGIAHVDGVERILKERGWQEVKYSCL